ncbi:MAG: iron ABC transporter permease [Phycisphaerae bacterium]|nr:iron ABC transporter permease [Phycisphaerae bacterium]MBT5381648.1 iron ABC transporter permease [Phycisphaerae bacterium]
MSRLRIRGFCAAIVIALIGVAVLRVLIGRNPLSGDLSLAWPDVSWRSFRLTAMIAGGLVGGALALAGTLLQASLRNPLASPSILGVSSGAGLGVMLALYVSHITGVPSPGWMFPAVVGAGCAVVLVLLLGRRDGWPDPVSTILAGVIIATMCGAGMVLLQGLVPEGLRGQFLSWALGTIPEVLPRSALPVLGGIVACGVAWAIWFSGRLDALLLDHGSAVSIGAAPGATRLICLVLAGALTAVTVALCGPIGFVGLVSPHVARRLVGPGHRLLVPAAVLCGATLVVGADVMRQAIDLGSGRLPVGVLTTLVGGPFFLWLLRRGGRHVSM